jgi:hypothetical protein
MALYIIVTFIAYYEPHPVHSIGFSVEKYESVFFTREACERQANIPFSPYYVKGRYPERGKVTACLLDDKFE